MRFFHLASVTQTDLDAALEEVLETERTTFYKDLVVDDTWNALIKQKLPERYNKAEETLHQLAGNPLQQRIRAELKKRKFNPDDPDFQKNIHKSIWHTMQYEELEPLTYDFLTAEGVPLPSQTIAL
jgi:hypothetical protein